MKQRISILWVTLLILVGLTGCKSDSKKSLQLVIKELNAECPIPLGAFGQMDNVTYSGNLVTFNYTLAGSVDINSFRDNKEQFHQFMLDNYRNNSDESFRQILKAIIEAEANLDVAFKSEDGDFYVIHFTDEEISENFPVYNGDSETYLQSTLQTIRMQLPITYSEGMTCTYVDIDSYYLTYYFECDETLFNIDEMQRNILENYEEMKNMIISSSDASFVKIMNML